MNEMEHKVKSRTLSKKCRVKVIGERFGIGLLGVLWDNSQQL